MPAKNVGVNVPLLMARLVRLLFAEAVRVIVIVYVCVVPSCAVTIVVMVFGPTARFIGADAEPLATVAPLTMTVAVASLTVGVTVMLVVAFGTDAVQLNVPGEKDGVNVPLLIARLVRLLLEDAARFIMIV